MLLTHESTSEPRQVDLAADPHPSSSVMLRGEGRVSMARRGPRAIVSRLAGTIERAHVEWLLGELEHQIAAGATTLFVDGSRATVVDPSALELLGHGLAKQPPSLARVHVLGESVLDRLGSWGRSVQLSPDAESFRAALADADLGAGPG